MAKRGLMVAAGIAAFLGFLVAMVPASQLARRLPANIVLERPSGTIWSGQARSLAFQGRPLGALRWSCRPWRLVFLEWSCTVRLQPPGGDRSEPDFLNELARRTGCRLLVDVNNIYVNALNAQRAGADGDPVQACRDWLDRIDPRVVGELHLAGHCVMDDIVIDDHGSRVCDAVWRIYRHALARFGAVPALIECLKDGNTAVQQFACNVLANVGASASDALPALRKLAEGSSNAAVQNSARNAINNINTKK